MHTHITHGFFVEAQDRLFPFVLTPLFVYVQLHPRALVLHCFLPRSVSVSWKVLVRLITTKTREDTVFCGEEEAVFVGRESVENRRRFQLVLGELRAVSL